AERHRARRRQQGRRGARARAGPGLRAHIMIFGRFIKQPQTVWARRALFQVHLWTGMGVGLYMLMISITGSAIVFRREITRLSWTAPTVKVTGKMMTAEQLSAAAKKAYPRFETFRVKFDRNLTRAAVVTMTRGQRARERAFDPYTGKDLSDVGTDKPWLLNFTVKLHDKLQPPDPNSLDLRSGDEFLAWLARVHFGRAYGTTVKWVYVVLGLVPAVLFVTGAIMWWNRVIVPAMRKSARAAESLQPEVSS